MIGWRPRLRLFWSRIRGTNNTIALGRGARLVGYVEIRGTGNKVILDDDAYFSGRIYVKGKNQTLKIGAGSRVSRAFVVMQENCDISIGAGCFLSQNVEIRTSDAHSVIDVKTRHRINPAAPVDIGDHVWIGPKAFISKGTVIGSDSAVKAASFVAGAFPESNLLIAGVPGRIIQRGITWNIDRRGRLDPASKAFHL